MVDIKATVILFNSSKTCFISLPASWLNGYRKSNPEPVVYELTDGSTTAYVSWAGDVTHVTTEGVEINGLFAAKLGFKHGSEVTIKQVLNVSPATRLFIEPVSFDDWEILELNAGFIEAHLLDQVRLVWDGQVLPVWVTKSICVFVTVVKVEPSCKCGSLQQLTEVIVSPKSRSKEGSTIPNTKVSPLKSSHQNNGSLVDTDSALSGSHRSKDDCQLRGSIAGAGKNSLSKHSQQDMETRTDKKKKSLCSNSQFSIFWDVLSYFKSWVFEADTGKETTVGRTVDVSDYTRCEIVKSRINLKLRVQPLTTSADSAKGSTRTFPSLESIQNNLIGHQCSVSLTDQPTTVYILSQTLYSMLFDSVTSTDRPTSFIANISKLRSPSEMEDKSERSKKLDLVKESNTKSENGGDQEKPVEDTGCVVRVVVLDKESDVKERKLFKWEPLEGSLLVPDLLRRQVGLETASQVHLQSIEMTPRIPCEVQLTALLDLPLRFTPEMVIMAFETWLSQVSSYMCPLICGQGILLRFPLLPDVDGEFLLTFEDKIHHQVSGPAHIYYAIWRDMLKTVKVKFVGRLSSKTKPAVVKSLPYWSVNELDLPSHLVKLENLGGITDVAKKAMLHLTACLAVQPLASTMFGGSPGMSSGGLLVSGTRGSGKSSLVRAVAGEMTKYPNLVYLRIIDCKPLRAKRVESLKSMWLKVFNEAAWRQPSLILMDDLDHVTPASMGHEQEMSGESVYFTRVAKALIDILNSEIVQQSRIVVMATSQSRSSLHQSLVSSRGCHFFQEFVTISTPDAAQRKSILDAIIVSKQTISLDTLTFVDTQHWAAKTQGSVARDLVKLVDRAVHAHLMKTQSVKRAAEVCLDNASFEQAMQGFQPSSLQNVSLHRAGSLGWADVGNLDEVKSTLMETLQWPSKYPTLFANCPLRLRSGILLYGAPGTGKTLLAGVVAKECGLNFISIKGPELLSKYIGASEQAVRDTFQRAQSAKPCILFFDEFDAIAPRRGHDSTGVTDRVVNQLLTQLDGVEGLDGVYVLAATSRPDLVDPALLRPGRLDKSLCCPLPDEGGRLEILHALTRNIHLADDVDLSALSRQCQHFTGADFKALLYNAQLGAIQQTTNYRYLGTYKARTREGEDELDKTVVMLDQDTSSQKAAVLYMPTLGEGVVGITRDFKEKILAELGPLGKKKSENNSVIKEPTAVTPVITQENLLKAASSMRPSVSEKERQKYQAIYENFVDSRGGHFASTENSSEKRQTLA